MFLCELEGITELICDSFTIPTILRYVKPVRVSINIIETICLWYLTIILSS